MTAPPAAPDGEAGLMRPAAIVLLLLAMGAGVVVGVLAAVAGNPGATLAVGAVLLLVWFASLIAAPFVMDRWWSREDGRRR